MSCSRYNINPLTDLMNANLSISSPIDNLFDLLEEARKRKLINQVSFDLLIAKIKNSCPDLLTTNFSSL